MKYLLDTHVMLWYFLDSERLPRSISDIIDYQENNIVISSISLLEITIKESKNKLHLGMSLDELYYRAINRRFSLIQIEIEHLLMYRNLPYIHKDPYDRMLIATSICEKMSLITSDKDIQLYDFDWVWE